MRGKNGSWSRIIFKSDAMANNCISVKKPLIFNIFISEDTKTRWSNFNKVYMITTTLPLSLWQDFKTKKKTNWDNGFTKKLVVHSILFWKSSSYRKSSPSPVGLGWGGGVGVRTHPPPRQIIMFHLMCTNL